MKIVIEELDLEEFVMEGESCVAVPLDIFCPKEGECVATVYSRFEKQAKDFAEKYGEDPLSDEALEYIDSIFAAPMEEAGYAFDSKGDFVIHKFSAPEGYKSTAKCPLEIVKIETNEQFEKYYNNATRDVELDDDDPLDAVFAAVNDGCIVSFSAVNDLNEDDSLEINVETSVEARGKGCATAVVSALCQYLTEQGEKVTYRTRCSNKASVRVAEKAGLVHEGVGFSYVCYRNED